MESDELRIHIFPVEIRAKPREGKLPLLEGTAIPYNSRSELLYGAFYEMFSPGAFTEHLRTNPDVAALADHDTGKVLGRTSAKTLTLREDEKGVHIELDPANTSYGRDIVELVTRGDITGMSFSFRTISDQWSMQEGKELRTVTKATLREVSIVAFPAYQASEIMKRSLDSVNDRHRAMVELAKRQDIESLDILRRRLAMMS